MADMSTITTKTEHLLGALDRTQPAMTAVLASPDPAVDLLAHLSAPPRARFRFEYEQKARMLDFLREHYAAWQEFDTTRADNIAARSIAEAQGDRALHDIPELGKAWLATGDARYGAAFQRFYLETATGEMFNWGSFNGTQGAIELDAYFLLLDCHEFSTDGRIAFLDHLLSINEDAWETHTSRWRQTVLGPEGHNWYLHGMHSLPFIGLLFPEFARASFLLRSSWSMVEDHLRGHYKVDGGARETCIGYQAGSVLNLWDLYLIAHRNGYPISTGFTDRLLTATKFLLRLMSPSAGLPSFGDGGHTPGSMTQLAAVATAMSGDRECKWYAEYGRRQLPTPPTESPGIIPETAFWAVGLEGARTYAETRARDPQQVSVLMGATGYAAMRNHDDAQALYLAVAAADRGPIVTSHGHNDIFALDLSAYGTRFLGEMGCVEYGDSAEREYDESTAAHNCLTIDGQEQVPLHGEWRWDGHAIPSVRRWISEETHDFFHGVHEGFYRFQRQETLHARKVCFLKENAQDGANYWVVFDWLESEVAHNYRAYFHGCVPGRLEGHSILLGAAGQAQLAILPPENDALEVVRVQEEGLTAYQQAKAISAEDYPCFAYSRHAADDCLPWVLAPLRAGAPAPRVRRLPLLLNSKEAMPHDAVALEIAFPTHTDLLCLSHKDFDAEMACGEHVSRGFLAFRRVNKAGELLLAFEHTMADGSCGR